MKVSSTRLRSSSFVRAAGGSWSHMRRAVLVLLASSLLHPYSPAWSQTACTEDDASSGHVAEDGRLEVGKKKARICRRPGGSGTDYPRNHWTTHDIFWGSTAGCPDGMVDGIRRHWVVTGPGEAPTMLYDAPACVPVPFAGEDGSVDAVDVEAILRGVLPKPAVARDPYADGLVGLETRFWYAGDDLHEVDHDGDPATPPRYGWTGSTSRNGITITATLYVERFSWQVDADREVSAARPGSADDPAATHTYWAKGTYELVASTTWTGSYRWSIAGVGGDAAAALDGDGVLNGVTLSSDPQPFRVREIRAVPADQHAGDR
jgi:hypothetical protein